MSEANHTPGPWYVGPDNQIWRRPHTDLYQYGGGIAGDAPLASVSAGHLNWVNKFPAEANARLISAAPELLEALEAFIDLGIMENDNWPELVSALTGARAAIAKARGN